MSATWRDDNVRVYRHRLQNCARSPPGVTRSTVRDVRATRHERAYRKGDDHGERITDTRLHDRGSRGTRREPRTRELGGGHVHHDLHLLGDSGVRLAQPPQRKGGHHGERIDDTGLHDRGPRGTRHEPRPRELGGGNVHHHHDVLGCSRMRLSARALSRTRIDGAGGRAAAPHAVRRA
jgi:hypothetical protein